MTDERSDNQEQTHPGATDQSPTALDAQPAETASTPPPPMRITSWVILSMLLTVAFLVPVFMLMKPAAQPSARAAHAAKHGFIQLDNEEGALLYQARLFSEGRGRDLYHSLEQPPYVVGTYTPVFMAVVGLTDSFNPASFRAGRIFVWCAAMGIGMLLVLLVAMAARNAPVGILAGFMFLATWEVYRWIGYFRVDFPAIFLSLAGLGTVVLGAGKRPALALGSLLMVAGLYTKQTVIAAPVACFAALLFCQPRLRAVEFAGWMLLWGLPPLILLHLWTDGQFYQHAFVYNINEWHDFNLQAGFRHVWFMHKWIILAAAVAVLLALNMMGHRILTRNRTGINQGEAPLANQPVLFHFWQPLAWYAWLAPLTFFAIAKGGSAENYVLEPLIGVSMGIGLSAGAAVRMIAVHPGYAARSVATLGAAAILVLTTIHARVVTQPVSYEMRFHPMIHASRADFEASQLILARMREAENPLSELAIYHLQLDEPPVIQPFIMSELARQGIWDQTPFVKSIEAADYDLVVALDDLTESGDIQKYTPEMLSAFHAAYRLDVSYSTPIWTYHVLVPKEKDDQPTAEEFATSHSGTNVLPL